MKWECMLVVAVAEIHLLGGIVWVCCRLNSAQLFNFRGCKSWYHTYTLTDSRQNVYVETVAVFDNLSLSTSTYLCRVLVRSVLLPKDLWGEEVRRMENTPHSCAGIYQQQLYIVRWWVNVCVWRAILMYGCAKNFPELIFQFITQTPTPCLMFSINSDAVHNGK